VFLELGVSKFIARPNGFLLGGAMTSVVFSAEAGKDIPIDKTKLVATPPSDVRAEDITELLCPLPPLPQNEKQRIKLLNFTNLLDSKEEIDFDRLTSIAARIFNVPICLIRYVLSSNHT
jgi:hypothetical protein